MSVYSSQIIQIFYGKKFLDAAFPMSILMSGVTFLTIFYVMAFALNGAGKVKAPMWISFVGLATNIILSYFLIKKYTLSGAAVATSITSGVAMILILTYSYNFFGYLFKFSSFLKITLASVIMYLLSIFFPKSHYAFILWSVILFIVYLGMLYVFKEFGASELETMKLMLKRKKTPREEREEDII
jgi:O-antigen/teichoic acid export membrane protein